MGLVTVGSGGGTGGNLFEVADLVFSFPPARQPGYRNFISC